MQNDLKYRDIAPLKVGMLLLDHPLSPLGYRAWHELNLFIISRQLEKKKAQAQRLEDQLFKLEVTATDKEENKEIALGTSKLNYLDPRITVAW